MSDRRTARQTRPPRPAAPLPGGVDLMDRTHHHTQQVLLQMVQLADLLGQGAPTADTASLAARVCTFFNGPVRGHHEAEETQVFPGLLERGDAALREHVRRLQQDHMWLEEDWLELEPHLQAVASGYCTDHREFLRAALPEFAELCLQHMALEESLVHPEAGLPLVLTETGDQEL